MWHANGNSVIRGQSGNYLVALLIGGGDNEYTEFLLEGKGEDGIDNTTK